MLCLIPALNSFSCAFCDCRTGRRLHKNVRSPLSTENHDERLQFFGAWPCQDFARSTCLDRRSRFMHNILSKARARALQGMLQLTMTGDGSCDRLLGEQRAQQSNCLPVFLSHQLEKHDADRRTERSKQDKTRVKLPSYRIETHIAISNLQNPTHASECFLSRYRPGRTFL